jgi:hypothetical protein
MDTISKKQLLDIINSLPSDIEIKKCAIYDSDDKWKTEIIIDIKPFNY